MNYRIVGADGKTYGPVGLEQLRQWLVQGRVDRRTPVLANGASEWTILGRLPEFAGEPGTPPPNIGAWKPLASAPRGTNGFAIAGLACSLLAWVCCCCLPFNLLGLVFSIIALVQINAQPEPQEGRVFAIIGLVLSGTNLLFSFGLGLMELLLNPNNLNINFGQF